MAQVKTITALQAEKEKLIRMNQKEYQTRGNTQRCQEIYKKIEAIEAQINCRMNQFVEGV